MVEPLSTATITGALADLPHAAALSARVAAHCLAAARARNRDFLRSGARPGDEVPLGSEQLARTPFGDVQQILAQGTEDPTERTLVATLLAMGVAAAPADFADRQAQTAAELVWLVANTGCNAFDALDSLLSDQASAALYNTVAEIAAEAIRPNGFTRLEVLTAAVLLAQSSSTAAVTAAASLATHAPPDPLVVAVLGRVKPARASLRGEMARAPRHAVLTALLAVTLVLPVVHLGRLLVRYALGYRRPAEIQLSREGLRLTWHTELLGRRTTDRCRIIPLGALTRVTREVRYARAGLYAGLAALALGTFLGVGLLLDGLLAPGGSGPLVVLGLLCLLGGVGLDFVLSTLVDSARGTCRLVAVPLKGKALCVGALDPRATDAMLTEVASAVPQAPNALPRA